MTFNPTSTTVAVLKGGTSAEREVSLHTGENCAAALREAGFTVTEYDTQDLRYLDDLRSNKPDVAFIALHGRGGEDGTMQGLLELLSIPYTGSGVLSSALAMDKVMTKHIYTQAGLPTADYLVATREESFYVDTLAQKIVEELGTDVVVKPNSEGSSFGVHIIHDPAQLPEALEDAFCYDDLVLVERFIPGLEIMAGVLGNAGPAALGLPLIEVESTGAFYDYESKYAPGGSRHILPARLDEATTTRCQDLATAAHTALGCRGYSRSDIRIDPTGAPYLLETNTLPGMTATSLLPEEARAIGIDFPDLCTRIIEFALT
jgi:D-alanine-D-alanine ligase